MLSGALDRLRRDLLMVRGGSRSRYESALLDDLNTLDSFLTRMAAAPGATGTSAAVIDLAPEQGDTNRLRCNHADCPIKALG